MKKLIYAICMGAAVAFSSCEDMLDTTNYTEKTTATFPESYDDAQQMIAGVYASMASVCANPERSFLYYIPDKRRATGKPRRDLGTDLARP